MYKKMWIIFCMISMNHSMRISWSLPYLPGAHTAENLMWDECQHPTRSAFVSADQSLWPLTLWDCCHNPSLISSDQLRAPTGSVPIAPRLHIRCRGWLISQCPATQNKQRSMMDSPVSQPGRTEHMLTYKPAGRKERRPVGFQSTCMHTCSN